MGKEMSKILPGLYLGRLDNAQDDNDMMANCITHVLSVHEPVNQKLHKINSYEYLEINVKDEDSACISKYFCKTNDFIHHCRIKNGNVLIHCLAGVSRAPTIVLAYLMTVYELSFQDAFNCLKAVRPNIKPIATFVKQLNDFETNEVVAERERLLNAFGPYSNLEDDKKLIKQLIAKYENQEHENYYIGESIDSNSSNFYNAQFGLDDENADGFGLLIDQSNLENDPDRLLTSKSECRSSPSPELEEEIDVPGSIPIGGVQSIKLSNLPTTGTSTSDYRGRAHSRQSQAASAIDTNPILNRYGQTAPPSLPLFFEKS